ncbi:DUF1206 domain-containing protein [Knoellia koreensis]|uniref:DUF1206 domain-containing protein n=1 Tax=Knoellia koreensis TaxID=2730921 RepID=A0A849HBP1_9MICO|nr:DUF1206 domain-containing protein [Knoellia sp. DB2414S]NNM45355.1 DUF1206 domain-containing protein [Knoellia sp. DB2414S]
MDSTDVKGAADRASDHPALTAAARAGYAVSGLIHLLIGWIALQVALGGGGKNADQSGALSTLAGNPLGKALLWVAVIGFLALAIVQLAEALLASGEGKDLWKDRGKAVGQMVLYLALASSALTFARGGSKNSRSQSQDFTASLLDKPGGRLLVIVIGLAVLAAGGYHVYKGWSEKFLEDLESHPGRAATVLGRVGFIAKGLVLAIVGVLFVAAGLHRRAAEASGMDGALKSLREQPFGTILLILIAAGLVAFGLYCFARAKHAKV